MVSFSADLDGFSLRLRVEAAPIVPRASKPRMEVGSGTERNSFVTVPPSKLNLKLDTVGGNNKSYTNE